MDFTLFENTLDSERYLSYLFTSPVIKLCATNKAELDSFFDKLTDYQKQGLYLAGYIAYDAIFAIEPKLNCLQNSNPNRSLLAEFVVYRNCECFASKDIDKILLKNKITPPSIPNIDKLISLIELEYDLDEYTSRFGKIQEYLCLGDSYQANLTLSAKLTAPEINSFDLYYFLSRRQRVPYAAYLPSEKSKLLSFSPELFFAKKQDKITVCPMKGTMPRGINGIQDQINCNLLQNDPKNLAENLIIVDLLRNDLAKFAKTGSVHANKLFNVEKYSSLFQMTSEIEASLDPSTTLSKVISQLFPCGSITGAPKLRTMEIINEVERRNRGIYSGAIGFVLPNNDMVFNVAIRTLVEESSLGDYNLGVGGGITINSNVSDEWDEINTKLRFLTNCYYPKFKLVESMLYKGGEIVNLKLHLNRLQSSAQKLIFKVDIDSLYHRLSNYLKSAKLDSNQAYKLRLELDFSGNLLIEHQPIGPSKRCLNVALLMKSIDTRSHLFRYKTTSSLTRGLYERLYNDFKPQGVDELIFVNQDNIVTESRYYNLVIDYKGQLLTPPISAGLLPGVYRQSMIDSKRLVEAPITPDEVLSADNLYLCNDVRGMVLCNLMGKV